MTTSTPQIFLRKNEDRRLRAGHLWVYSNEVDVKRTPLTAFEPGQPVLIMNSQGNSMGTGYVNPHSLIAVRVMSRNQAKSFTDDDFQNLLRRRLAQSLALRELLYDEPFYRLVYGESDGLPGLVVDRFGDYLTVQITTAGMERQRDALVTELQALIRPKGILLRNDHPLRALEQLPMSTEVAAGEVPDTLTVREAGCEFSLDPREGQKTGWYYDQAANRADIDRWVKGKRVLDVCCYNGAWAVRAAKAGASEVIAVDVSASALAQTHANAERNDVSVTTIEGDAFEVLRSLAEEGERFDVVLVDPPPFIKRKKDMKAGTEAYQRLNRLAMRLLRPPQTGVETGTVEATTGGVLMTSSCSQHFSADALMQAVRKAALQERLRPQILRRGGQGPDHPGLASMPETDYLHSYFVRLVA